MEANDFVAKLKANGSGNDLCDLTKVIEEHKHILSKLPPKDRGCFCLNVLSILCRNIEKVPKWKDSIDPKLLLPLCVDCVRETRTMERVHRVKTLACVFHLHRFIVRLKSPLVPELVLKLSYVPFEYDTKDMLAEHAKTYCSILVDRVSYMQLLKAGKMAVSKLLPKLTEDILKVIQIYDTAQFCINALTFLIKNLNFLFNDRNSTDLNKVLDQIFKSISTKSDLNCFKKLTEKECLDLYVKLNDCFYVLVENSSRNKFNDSILNSVMHTYISMLGHCSDIFYCFQTFYSNIFCNIFTTINNTSYNETMFNSLLMSCENSEKLGYTKIMQITLPFMNQLLRFYIDYLIANIKNWYDVLTEQCQQNCLKIILFIMKKSKNCNQLVKCDNCTIKNGLHDALRLSFLSIQFVKQTNLDSIIELFTSIIIEQHSMIKELTLKGCKNHEKYYKKLQIDIHNTAILLNKSKKYEYSIKLFNIYLENEISNFKDASDLKNISRALFNKSICELDCKNYDDALKNAFLSLVFAYPESLNSDKYVSLVMDVKAKALKATESDEGENKLQIASVLDACEICMENGLYGNLKPFFVPMKFSVLLKHEFSIYAKLWPAVVPIAGVWKSLYELVCKKHTWVSAENSETVLSTLYDVILETSTVVRSMNNDYYKNIVGELVAMFDAAPAKTTEMQLMQAAMLFLKAEFDLRDAGEKYGWKITETITDPEQIQSTRTVSQEYKATRRAIQAVHLMTELSPNLTTVQVTNRLQTILELAEIFVQQLLHLYRRRHALQLAYTCCILADHVGNKVSYIRNAGVLLSHADRQTDELDVIITKVNYAELLADENSIDPALGFLCDVAIYKIRTGAIGTAARLIQIAQSQILQAYEKYPEVNLSLSTGRVLEAQCQLSGDTGFTSLSSVSCVQRHYLAMNKVASTRHATRLLSLTSRTRISSSSTAAVTLARSLLLRRRAVTWSAAAVTSRGALAAAETTVRAACGNVDCVTLDNRLKYILGLHINENINITKETASKTEIFTPKQDIEIMLENVTFKKTQVSPSVPCNTVHGFKTPEFLKHTKCDCFACDIPMSYILSACTIGWEAVMYFRARETEIARNYFDGAAVCFQLAERKLMGFDDRTCEKFIVEAIKRDYMKQLKRFEVEILIEKAFFELSLKNYDKTDAIIVQIHEILQEFDVGAYSKNDVLNLMVTSAELRRNIKKHVDTSLEAEFEMLKLSPVKDVELQKTPEIKAKAPPKIQKVTVPDEDLPKKRKVIKLNLDETTEEKDKVPKKKSEFKIPVPVTKHVLENITPRNTRSKPNILVTQAQTPSTEYSTPVAATPDEFFTPMSTIRTYSKKSLRQNLVKNLENEFSTPKGGQSASEKLEVPKSKAKDSKSMLKRATSPGKLVKKIPTRSTRKPQIKLNVDDAK